MCMWYQYLMDISLEMSPRWSIQEVDRNEATSPLSLLPLSPRLRHPFLCIVVSPHGWHLRPHQMFYSTPCWPSSRSLGKRTTCFWSSPWTMLTIIPYFASNCQICFSSLRLPLEDIWDCRDMIRYRDCQGDAFNGHRVRLSLNMQGSAKPSMLFIWSILNKK